MPRRIVICGATYSRNLGDGILSDCLAFEMRRQCPNIDVVVADISGRQGYHESVLKGKARILSTIRRLPRILSRALVLAGLLRFAARKAVPAWKSFFRKDDLVVIGGGHLLLDHNLNFPVKLAILSYYARKNKSSCALYGVGVSPEWSYLGKFLFSPVVQRSHYVSVRDKSSKDYLERHLPDLGQAVNVVVDPGYLAAIVYANVPSLDAGVGLNISDPDELSTYGSGLDNSVHRFDQFWADIAKYYLESGRKVTIFTNGADEDEDYVARLVAGKSFNAIRDRVNVVDRASTPAQLVATVKSLQLLIGHRLHSHIVAFAHKIPSVAIGWDTKIISQMDLMGRSRFYAPFDDVDVGRVVSLAEEAEGAVVDVERVAEMGQRVRDNVTQMLSEIALKGRNA